MGNSSMHIKKEHHLFPWLGDKVQTQLHQLAILLLCYGAALLKQLYVAKNRLALRDH